MTKFELIKEYYQLTNQVKTAHFDGNWVPLYNRWCLVGSKLLDEMKKMEVRENETINEYLERRFRLRETIFGN